MTDFPSPFKTGLKPLRRLCENAHVEAIRARQRPMIDELAFSPSLRAKRSNPPRHVSALSEKATIAETLDRFASLAMAASEMIQRIPFHEQPHAVRRDSLA
jgi:hypothetical protein